MKLTQATVEKILDLINDDLSGQDITEPLDGDDVQSIIQQLRINLDFNQGNLTEEEKQEQENQKIIFTNNYECEDCSEKWQDERFCWCNDHCPKCNKEIEPYWVSRTVIDT
jgi:hypothetical protein